MTTDNKSGQSAISVDINIMKVAKLYSFDDIRIEDIPVPEVGPGEALIKVRASGICSGDVMPWYIEKKAPLVLGHEPAGEIWARISAS